MAFLECPLLLQRCFRLATLVVAALFVVAAADTGTMRFKVNPLTEEEQSSKVIPDVFKCDACKAVVHQLEKVLRRAKIAPRSQLQLEGGGGSDRRAIQEQAVRVTAAAEEACDRKTYKEYGIKETTEGERRLHGDGIEVTQPGIVQGGGPWSARLAARCASLVEEVEDQKGSGDLAERWLKGSLSELCAEDCQGGEQKVGRKGTRRPRAAETLAAPAPRPRPRPRPSAALELLPPPPHECLALTADNASSFIDGREGKQPRKFRLVLFHDGTEHSARAVAIMELAARKLRKAKEKDLRKMAVGRFDSSDGDTHGYRLKRLPKMLFFRRGYRNPKVYDGALQGPDDLFDWLRNEVLHVYMKDDREAFPRVDGDSKREL
eukprot:TRINITY_DN49420_c0_g1_i1.p1 TRINITY_DN49420_c0_g1~~TRINITY_DN49420_c0_g1_i1.p1  ORF type:complete len:377 (+),score=70.20 TRINITY_DN49420_c0_g1_i1:50-1180(+)